MADLRPFCFTVTLWGDRYRRYFTDWMLPSLMAPHNLPYLNGRRPAHLVIACPPEDAKEIAKTPIFEDALHHGATAYFIPIPYPPEGVTAWKHMGVGHMLATQKIAELNGYGIMLTPDLIVSNGIVAMLDAQANTGKTVVLAPALRFAEEPLLKLLLDNGAQPCFPMAVDPVSLCGFALQSLHPENVSYKWDAPHVPQPPAAEWWPAPGGIVLHCLSWAPLLLDYAALHAAHDQTTLERWTMDGDYVFQNWGDQGDKLHVLWDSDEGFIASFTPIREGPQPIDNSALFNPKRHGELVKGAVLRQWLLSKNFDPLKRRLFSRPVRWHAAPIEDAVWKRIEAKALETLRGFLGDIL